jgi:hypothetical protein
MDEGNARSGGQLSEQARAVTIGAFGARFIGFSRVHRRIGGSIDDDGPGPAGEDRADGFRLVEVEVGAPDDHGFDIPAWGQAFQRLRHLALAAGDKDGTDGHGAFLGSGRIGEKRAGVAQRRQQAVLVGQYDLIRAHRPG